jgi:hypothetical protein
MTITPADQRLLDLADRAVAGPGRTYRLGHREPGELGRLSRNDAERLVLQGMSNLDIAQAAGVRPASVSRWKTANGLSRAKKPNGAP